MDGRRYHSTDQIIEFSNCIVTEINYAYSYWNGTKEQRTMMTHSPRFDRNQTNWLLDTYREIEEKYETKNTTGSV